VKLQVIANPKGRKWPIGHTVLIDDETMALRLIEEGACIVHPTVTDPAPTHPCPCEDEDEPCEECEESIEEEVSDEAFDEEPTSNE
jgi:hypothetical protein